MYRCEGVERLRGVVRGAKGLEEALGDDKVGGKQIQEVQVIIMLCSRNQTFDSILLLSFNCVHVFFRKLGYYIPFITFNY